MICSCMYSMVFAKLSVSIIVVSVGIVCVSKCNILYNIIICHTVLYLTSSLPVMNLIKFTHQRITSLIITHMVNISQST